MGNVSLGKRAVAPAAIAALIFGWPQAGLAQAPTPAADGSGTVVTLEAAPTGSTYLITGGTTAGDNLLHSFTVFNLSAGEVANFVTAASVQNVLGQITGGDASVIDGLLQVSGSGANLFLINPAGILLGPNAALNLAGGFTATTASGLGFGNLLWSIGTAPSSALAGSPTSFVFGPQPGAVVSAATLAVNPGESLLLLGGQVIHTGTLSAPGGEITIAAVPGENRVRLSQAGGLLSLELETLGPAAAATPLAATDLPALLTGPVAAASGIALNADGSLRLAGSALDVPMTVGTSAIAGQLNSSAAGTGGSITLLGQQIALTGAEVQANGGSGGGTLRLGGEALGQGPLPNARAIFVDAASQLQADALGWGDGGRVILWSDQASRIEGSISAQGGPAGGNGGWVETSSAGWLAVEQAPNMAAPAGRGGTWLLDPETIQIISQFTTALPEGNFGSAGNVFSPSPPGAVAVIRDLTLSDALAQGNVFVVTNDGDILLADPTGFELQFETATGGNTLSFLASNQVRVQSPVTVVGGGFNLVLTGDLDGNGEGQVEVAADLTSGGGDITLSGRSTSGSGLVISSTLNSGGGQISLTGVSTGPARLSQGLDLQQNALLLSGGGNVQLSGFSSQGTGVLVNGAIATEGGDLSIAGTTASPSFFGLDIDAGAISSFNGDLAFSGTNLAGATGLRLVPELLITDASLRLTAPQGDIEFSALAAVNSQIEITAERFIRLTGLLIEGPQASAAGSEGTVIRLQHGGGGRVPFIVGDAAINGSAGPIFDETSAFLPVETLFDSAIRGNLAILTERLLLPPAVPPGVPPLDPPPASPPGEVPPTDCLSGCLSNLPAAPAAPPAAGDDLPVAVAETATQAYAAWVAADLGAAQAFTDHLAMPPVGRSDFAAAEAQLQSAASATGVKPALVYVSFVPADLTALQAAASPTDQLELILVTPGQPPLRLRVPGASRDRVLAAADQLRREVTDQTRLKTTTYLAPAQTLHQWLIAPLTAELQARGVSHLSFVLAAGLRSLPLAALHDGQRFLIERYSLGLMPSLSLTDSRYVNLQTAPVLAMGASEFTDLPALPAVPVELETVTRFSQAGEAVLNQGFTPEALVQRRRVTPYPIVHLATHGEFEPGSLQASYIQFWQGRLPLDQIHQLGLNEPPLELLVLSACRMALGDEAAELGFAGLAVKAGAKSAIASLWRVSDVGTAGLMSEFYNQLQVAPMKAEALRQAQLAMLSGEIRVQGESLAWSSGRVPLPNPLAKSAPASLSHPYYWAAFTLVGSPW